MEKGIEKRIINRHYIGVVREVNDHLNYEEVEIPQDDNLICEIDAMKENDNCTLLDVQQRFTTAYPRECVHADGWNIWSPDGYYNYLYPYSYCDAYVRDAGYPNILTYDEYTKLIQEKEKSLRDEYMQSDEMKNSLAFVKNISEEKFNSVIADLESKIAKEVKDYITSLRKGFDYKRFIYAHNYRIKLSEICNDNSVKMFSTEKEGWKDFYYKVNDDITIYIKTNFGYGSASYFFCNLQYKDINILPYSWTVKYYYVKMTDFVRYTRRYSPERESWPEVFDFTVLTANMAKHEPEKFIKEWIVDEVEEMMRGMRIYMSSTDEALEKFLDLEKKPSLLMLNEVTEYTLKNVIRNVNDTDIEEYKALPHEKVIAFKAEKITGSLLLLDNLRKLTEISPVIIPYITEIEQMNTKLQPEIENYMNNISTDIERLKTKRDEMVKELKSLNMLLKDHEEKKELMRKEINKEREDENKMNDTEVVSLYKREHPEYVELNNSIEILTEKRDKLEKDIKLRKNFFEILTKCQKRIDKYIQAA